MKKTDRIANARSFYNTIMDLLDNLDCGMGDKYHILRYLTNFLESEEEEIYKKLNSNE